MFSFVISQHIGFIQCAKNSWQAFPNFVWCIPLNTQKYNADWFRGAMGIVSISHPPNVCWRGQLSGHMAMYSLCQQELGKCKCSFRRFQAAPVVLKAVVCSKLGYIHTRSMHFVLYEMCRLVLYLSDM